MSNSSRFPLNRPSLYYSAPTPLVYHACCCHIPLNYSWWWRTTPKCWVKYFSMRASGVCLQQILVSLSITCALYKSDHCSTVGDSLCEHDMEILSCNPENDIDYWCTILCWWESLCGTHLENIRVNSVITNEQLQCYMFADYSRTVFM